MNFCSSVWPWDNAELMLMTVLKHGRFAGLCLWLCGVCPILGCPHCLLRRFQCHDLMILAAEKCHECVLRCLMAVSKYTQCCWWLKRRILSWEQVAAVHASLLGNCLTHLTVQKSIIICRAHPRYAGTIGFSGTLGAPVKVFFTSP